MTQTVTILSNVEYGVPSGNYDGSSLDWYSPAVQAADYYQGRGSGTQTYVVSVNNFRGRLVFEATLDTDADSAEWFDLFEYGDISSTITDYHPRSVQGNFTWTRIRVELFESGTVNFVTVTY